MSGTRCVSMQGQALHADKPRHNPLYKFGE
jgi:hypothetical protein